MKEWNKPQLVDLSTKYTEAGGMGGAGDGVHYDVYGYIVIGTSGPDLPFPKR